jgi:pSer/pThr/pTyr-binding forkhead associated (FHA) protein
MARLFLTFEDRVIREVALSGGIVTIGRQADNLLQIDNPAVSGYHAKVYWESDHYILEDIESFNGTFVNNHRIHRTTLADGDKVFIGKHTLVFRAQDTDALSASPRAFDRSVSQQSELDKARLLQLDRTVILDTKRGKEILARAAAAAAGARGTKEGNGVNSQATGGIGRALTRRHTVGMLNVLAGRTDRRHYVLSSKLNAIGRSKLATIRLKGWFAPRIAASIQQREDAYFIVAATKNNKIRVNGKQIGAGQEELRAGDVIEIAGIKMKFEFEAS